MLTYRLVKTLNQSEDSQWQQLVASNLGTQVHPDRARGFALAREALRGCFSQHGRSLNIPEIQLTDHHLVPGLDSFTISLSHTKEWGAAVVAERSQVLSVGIDIEPLSRMVKPVIVERISHPEDISLPPLTLWAVKEACFKALMNTGRFSHPVEFSSLLIKSLSWEHHESGIQGEWKTTLQEGLCLALAWIKI